MEKELKTLQERLAKRKYNTQKARMEIAEILYLMSEKYGKNIEIFKRGRKKIRIMSEFDDELYECFLQIDNGRICFLLEGGYAPAIDIDADDERILYINFSDFLTALEEFINILNSVTTWDKETEKITEILKILKS